MVTLYHYTAESNKNSIQKGGLEPRTSLISKFSFNQDIIPFSDAFKPVIYALMEIEPMEWVENQEFPYLWGALMHHVSKKESSIIFEFDVLDGDEAYVIDRREYTKGLDSKSPITLSEAQLNYFNSRIPIGEYFGGFVFPEAIIYNRISPDRLRLCNNYKKNKLFSAILNFIPLKRR